MIYAEKWIIQQIFIFEKGPNEQIHEIIRYSWLICSLNKLFLFFCNEIDYMLYVEMFFCQDWKTKNGNGDAVIWRPLCFRHFLHFVWFMLAIYHRL